MEQSGRKRPRIGHVLGLRRDWKLDGDGEPQWLTVIEVMSDVSDVVRSASSRPPSASFYAAHP